LRYQVFTSAAVDNIDHNPTSSTSKDAFHGTAISLFQHPDYDGQGTEMSSIILSASSKYIKPLPDFYTSYVPPVVTPSKDPTLPVVTTMAPHIDLTGIRHTYPRRICMARKGQKCCQ